MRKILRQPLLNAAVAACGVIDKSDPTPTLPGEEDGVRSGGSAQKQIVAQ